MKTPTNRNLLCPGLALTLALALWTPVQAQSAMPADGKMMMEGKKPMDGKMMADCQEMKEHKDKMMADMKAKNAELSAEVAAMNSAPDDQKLRLLATLVTHMVEQQSAMSVRREKMQAKMMKHMMQHMQRGKESMAQCPMMKGMDDMDGKSAGTDKEDHEDQK